MKQWPEEVNVIGKIYKIQYSSDPQCTEDGVIDHGDATIKLFNMHRPESEIMTILLHEIIHAVSDCLSDNFEEQVVERWAFAMSDTLVRNGLVDLPQDGERKSNGKSKSVKKVKSSNSKKSRK